MSRNFKKILKALRYIVKDLYIGCKRNMKKRKLHQRYIVHLQRLDASFRAQAVLSTLPHAQPASEYMIARWPVQLGGAGGG